MVMDDSLPLVTPLPQHEVEKKKKSFLDSHKCRMVDCSNKIFGIRVNLLTRFVNVERKFFIKFMGTKN